MKFNPTETAFITLDVQNGILNLVSPPEILVPTIARAVTKARSSGMHIIHVRIAFTSGQPELPDDLSFNPKHIGHMVKKLNTFIYGSKECDIHPDLLREGDTVIEKHRVSAFNNGTKLEMLLRNKGVRQLILCGVTTGGCVLSTVREAYDRDYGITVLSDACVDTDEEVNRVLLEKVIAGQANVITVDEFIKENE
ncbi:hypothetical protein FRB96_007256 [Tulasnella sp. 330]|nr:hypothetical protein FRB96_007256 [Tulasnella sp. 330]KAG8868754.1 hypothetical protein FRB97_001939 [Tulasnella sp. 331]KAG8869989.1 hypothetical protein FRB98_002028 [Tulasnella sp. 332]